VSTEEAGVRTLLTAAAALLATIGALAVPSASVAASCAGTVQIDSLDFSPTTALPGQTVTARVVARNCTAEPQSAALMIVAQFLGATPGIPAGCPVLDPLPPRTVAFPAGGSSLSSQSYLIFVGCTATALRVTARYTDSSGAVLATRSADLPIVAPGACAVTYRTTSEWPGGFVAQVTVANPGPAPITGWSVAFSYPSGQHISTVWNAAVQQDAAAVVAVNLAYNAAIAPGSAVSFGVLGTWHGADTAPGAFTLNGVPSRA
jgi:hypothetical protein